MAEITSPNGTPADWIGKVVSYADEYGKFHEALITNCFSLNEAGEPMTVNLVYVSTEADSTDQYGRQLVRKSSCVRRNEHSAHGNWFKLETE